MNFPFSILMLHVFKLLQDRVETFLYTLKIIKFCISFCFPAKETERKRYPSHEQTFKCILYFKLYLTRDDLFQIAQTSHIQPK